jgi:hypothetical protein
VINRTHQLPFLEKHVITDATTAARWHDRAADLTNRIK